MGRKITSGVITSKGETNELYLFIEEIYINKRRKMGTFVCASYKNKADRDSSTQNDDKRVQLFSDSVPLKYEFSLNDSELAQANFRNLGYNKIESSLTDKGFTNERED